MLAVVGDSEADSFEAVLVGVVCGEGLTEGFADAVDVVGPDGVGGVGLDVLWIGLDDLGGRGEDDAFDVRASGGFEDVSRADDGDGEEVVPRGIGIGFVGEVDDGVDALACGMACVAIGDVERGGLAVGLEVVKRAGVGQQEIELVCGGVVDVLGEVGADASGGSGDEDAHQSSV